MKPTVLVKKEKVCKGKSSTTKLSRYDVAMSAKKTELSVTNESKNNKIIEFIEMV